MSSINKRPTLFYLKKTSFDIRRKDAGNHDDVTTTVLLQKKNFYFLSFDNYCRTISSLFFSPPSKKLAQLFSLFPSVPFLFISTTINLAAACKKTFKLKASPGDIFQNNFYNFSLAEQSRSVFNCVARTTLSSCAKIKPKQKKCQNKTAKPNTKLFSAKSFSLDSKCAIYFQASVGTKK